jgi:hypothetical protein
MKTVTAVLAILIALSQDATGFAPSPASTTMTSSVKQLDAVKDSKNVFVNFFDQLDSFVHAFQDTFTDTKIETKKQTDWIDNELNELAQKEDELALNSAVNAYTDEATDELVADKPTDVWDSPFGKPKNPSIMKGETIAMEDRKVVEPKAVSVKKIESKDDWIRRDMEKAGSADHEFDDWVAEDMTKAGKIGSSFKTDWVAEDMKTAGEVGVSHKPQLKREGIKDKRALQIENLANEMTAAGRNTGNVRTDMEAAGKLVDKKATTTGWDAIEKARDKRYKDIYEDMEKAGKVGGPSAIWIAEDMTQTGRAVPAKDKLKKKSDDTSYNLEGKKLSAFDYDQIRKGMEEAGHAESRDWVAKDLMQTGEGARSLGHQYPTQKQNITDWLSSKSTPTEEDMAKVGRSTAGMKLGKERVTGKKLEEMVSEDMKMIGKTSSDNWIAHDMERAGRPETHLNEDTPFVSHKERETREFMGMRKPKLAPVVKEVKEDKKEGKKGELEIGSFESEVDEKEQVKMGCEDETATEEHHNKHLLRRSVKKILHPFKKWEDIE